MIPKILCPSCSKEVAVGDKFCSSCGTKLTWTDSATSGQEVVKEETTSSITCNMCGYQNKPGAIYCESCGVTIASPEAVKAHAVQSKQEERPKQKIPPLKSLQSWKITVAMAVVFIVALVLLQSNDKKVETPSRPAPMQQQQAAIPEQALQELQSLEEAVKKNPDDQQTQLRFANRLQDMRMFPRAATEYQKYLEKNSSDPNARVDLGVTYFELSLVDSVKHHEYLQLAQQEIQEALKYDPKHQLGYFNLGIVSLHAGEMEKARQWFQQCAAIDTTTETGHKAKMLIQQHTFNNPK